MTEQQFRRFAIFFAVAVIFFLIVHRASAAPFTPELRVAYNLANAHWGGPPEDCTSVDLQVVPNASLGDRLAEATQPEPGERVPCVFRIRREFTSPWRFMRACAITRHEVGHLHGYEHSRNPRSIMHDPIHFTPAQCWRAGLRLLNFNGGNRHE